MGGLLQLRETCCSRRAARVCFVREPPNRATTCTSNTSRRKLRKHAFISSVYYSKLNSAHRSKSSSLSNLSVKLFEGRFAFDLFLVLYPFASSCQMRAFRSPGSRVALKPATNTVLHLTSWQQSIVNKVSKLAPTGVRMSKR